MLERINNILQHNCLVNSDKTLLLGVSGGPDSLFLLDILHKLGYSLVAAHLDHGLRPEAEAEARKVERFVAALGIPFALGKTDVRSHADAHGMSIEEAARNLRYRFLFEQARKLGVQAVAVGHTADDQVETVLMHLLRGSGLSGLGGMQYRTLPHTWSQEIPLLRPMLGVWRSEVEVYIEAEGLSPSHDPTNLDQSYFRNQLRHELIPYLEKYNPRFRQLIWRTADILKAENQLLERETQKIWDLCVIADGPGFVTFNYELLREQELAIQRRIIRKGIARLRPGIRDLDYQTITRSIHFIHHPTQTNQIDLISGLRLVMEKPSLYLAGYEADLPRNEWPQMPSETLLHLEIPGRVSLRAGWFLEAELVADVDIARQMAFSNEDPYQAWMDVSDFEGDLILRGRRPGDRFKPLGLGGHTVKLSDIMINEKLPQRARDGWPVVYRRYPDLDNKGGKLQEEIVWIPGIRLSHPFRMNPGTRKAAHLKLGRTK